MATVEKLIRKRLAENEQIASMLATYGNAPAIFYQAAPNDKEKAWKRVQYPRIIFSADSFADAERDKRKMLSVDVLCSTTGTTPEQIEPYVRKALAGVFFTPDNGATFSAKWRDTQAFHEQSIPLLVGVTLNFDIYEYPLLETTDPDPVMAICRYAEEWDKNVKVIGRSELEEIFEPSREHPAIWFSKGDTSLDRQTNTVAWLNTELIVHLFAPTLQDRIAWLNQFSQSVALDGEIIMLDNSPMFVQRLQGDVADDEISGQLHIGVQYGLLRRPAYAHTMTKAILK